MSELEETPSLGIRWCPACEPDRDPTWEILQVVYCFAHMPSVVGADDGAALHAYLSGTMEAGGESNRAICDFLREAKKRETKKGKRR